MSKLSDKFVYYPFRIAGILRAYLPYWLPISEPTDGIFFLNGRGAPKEPTGTTFNLRER